MNTALRRLEKLVAPGGTFSKSSIYNLKSAMFSAPEGSRTPNPQLRRLMLYPIELLAQENFRFEIFNCGIIR